jgi:hypothetical protein
LCIEVEGVMTRRMSNLTARYSKNKLKMTNSIHKKGEAIPVTGRGSP